MPVVLAGAAVAVAAGLFVWWKGQPFETAMHLFFTLVWLYLEILRLLSKLNSRD